MVCNDMIWNDVIYDVILMIWFDLLGPCLKRNIVVYFYLSQHLTVMGMYPTLIGDDTREKLVESGKGGSSFCNRVVWMGSRTAVY